MYCGHTYAVICRNFVESIVHRVGTRCMDISTFEDYHIGIAHSLPPSIANIS